ncbi:MAG: DUF6537 domain-containing protein, partial [Pseudomonadota bacterium]
EEKIAAEFEGRFRVRHHLAPPMLSFGKDSRGRPRKRAFGPWMRVAFRGLARLKHLRGTRWDLFGHMAERRAERALIGWYEDLMARCAEARGCGPDWAQILAAPMEIRGFGPVKQEAAERVQAQVEKALHPRHDALSG